ncbi:MAG: response regulator [candidate division Zixibacteria bacterium]|nr:response regulator [candidate division Zixibacteria bacterium]
MQPNQTDAQKILVVDDDDTIRYLLMDTLSALGYRTVGAADGEDALVKIDQGNIDLVISDIRMPRLNGVNLLRRIKEKNPDLPVLIITAYNYAYTKDQVLQSGADGFLAKPFRINRIEEQIESILKNKTDKVPLVKNQTNSVLIVDDDDILLNMLMESLESMGFNPVGVGNGQEALEKIKTQNFDLIITDIKMPKMDGVAFLKQVKEIKPDLPVVMITGFSQTYTSQTAMHHGADGYLVKPFRIEKIEEMVRKLMNSKPEVKA